MVDYPHDNLRLARILHGTGHGSRVADPAIDGIHSRRNDMNMGKVAAFAVVSALALAASAAEKRWLGTDATSPTLASVAANWDPSGAPTVDDDVVLDAGSNNNPMTWDLDNGVKSWTQSDYTGTVTFMTGTTYGSYTCYGVTQTDGSKALEISGNLTLSSGTWTHEATPSVSSLKSEDLWKKGFGIYRLIVKVGGNCTIGSGATIDLNSKGFGTDGPGYGSTYTKNGNCASHGGFGGYNYACATNAAFIYGSVKQPISLGSGRSTRGGGAVRLLVAGALVLEGAISSIGLRNDYYPGSGGSIWITAASLSGAGSASVDGGSGTSGAGCAGGGRIAVYLTGDGADFSSFTGTITSRNTSNYGTCGTVYLETVSDNGTGKLVLACGTNASNSHNIDSRPELCTPLKADDSSDFAFSQVKLENWANLGILPGVTATVASVSASTEPSSSPERSYITMYGGALKIPGDGGSLTLSSAVLRTYYADSYISVGDSASGTLTIASGAKMLMNAATVVDGTLVAAGGKNGEVSLGADATVKDFNLPSGSTINLDGHTLTVTNPAKRYTQSVLGTVNAGDGGEIVWPQRGFMFLFR